MPDGDLIAETSYPAEGKEVANWPDALVTDRHVVVMQSDNRLRVLDRTTLQESWNKQVPFYRRTKGDSKDQPRRNGSCRLQPIAADATVIPILTGKGCGLLQLYDLDSGDVVYEFGDLDAPGGLSLRMGDRFLFSFEEALYVLDGQGPAVPLFGLEQLKTDQSGPNAETRGLADYIEIFGLTPVTETLVAVEIREFTNGEVYEFFAGIELKPKGSFLRWKRTREELQQGTPRLSRFDMAENGQGLMLGEVESDGAAVLAFFDPKSGKINKRRGYVSQPLGNPGYPSISLDIFPDDYSIIDATVISGAGAPGSDFSNSLARFDLKSGKRRWNTEVPQSKGIPKRGWGMSVTALEPAADGEHYYATYSTGDRSSDKSQIDLVEFDLASGKLSGRWPNVVGSSEELGPMSIVDDAVVVVSPEIRKGQPALVILRAT